MDDPFLPNTLAHRRLLLIMTTIVLNIVAVGLLTFVSWSDWRTGLALNLVDNAALLWFVIRQGDLFLSRLMVFGLAVGFTERAADAWLVDGTKTLDYSIDGGPLLWRSPLWMPFVWEIVAVQFGYVGLWLWSRFDSYGLVGVGSWARSTSPTMKKWLGTSTGGSTAIAACSPTLRTTSSLESSASPSFSLSWPKGPRVALGQRLFAGTVGGFGIFICYAAAYSITEGIALP